MNTNLIRQIISDYEALVARQKAVAPNKIYERYDSEYAEDERWQFWRDVEQEHGEQVYMAVRRAL